MPKKPEYIKTPGFIIEVPKDRRKGFFAAPKAPLVYWAFKNRPRVFISEKLIFTFNGKPVAEALVAKIEGPGKGEGEYQKWHKVYWKPVTFKRFRIAAEDALYHVTLQKNVDDILENGLKAEHGYQFFDDVPKSTYLTDKQGLPFWKEEIATYYGEPQVVLKINRSGLNLIPDEQGTHDAGAPAYRVEHDIPPNRIKLASTAAISKMKPSEARDVLEVGQVCFPEYPFEGIVKESIHGDYSHSYVAKLDGKIVGAYIIGTNQLPEIFPDKQTTPYLGKNGIEGVALFVLPEFRGTGVGRDLRAIPLQSGADYIWGQHFEDLNNLQQWVNFGRKHVMTYTDMGGNKIHITAMDLKTGKTADHDLETDSGEKYWAGVGNAASGILPVCPQKGTVCLAWRSQYVQSPDCWGTIGGAVQQGKSPQQSAKAELHEETGYSGGISLTPAYVFTDGSFTYHNFIGVVGSQFSFSPQPLSKEEYMVLKSKLRPEQYHQLIPGWETDHIEWVKYETVLDDMNENPEDYHPGMLKLFKNSKDAIERALGKKEPEQPKTAAHSPACKCEMCRSISAWMRPWLMGKCPEFALALSSIMPDAQFVAMGTAMFEHVGLRRGDVYYDVRGAMSKAQFAELFGSNENSVHDVTREMVMKDAYPSYIGHEDELVETSDFKLALRTVRRVFGSKTAELLPTAQPPDVRILPCPSGKKKYYDKATILHKERGANGLPPAAYLCPKCHWWHMTSKPQSEPNPTYRKGAAEQMHLFPSSQDAKFRQWFDGSKVVDQAGRPMPVYHGTRSSVDFDTFSVDGPPQVEDSYEGETTSSGSGWDPTAFLGSHFAEESRVANQFAQGEGWTKSRYEGEAEAPRVIQVFLRITHPKDFGTESNLHNFIYQGKITDDDVLGIGCRVETGYNPWEGDDDENVQKEIEAYYQKYENDQAFRAKENEYLMQQYRPMDMEDEMLRNASYELAMQARHKLEQSGVDGIRYKNEVEGGHAWIAFAPQQIKGVHSQFNPQDQRFVASEDKEADWKSRVVLPTALALGMGVPNVSPSTLSPQQQQQQVQRRQQDQMEKIQKEQLDALVKAISRAEGAKPERNNPGDLADFNTGKIRTFDTYEEGEQALRDQLVSIVEGTHPYIKPDMTLREAGLIYSNGDPNWARNVSLIMHVPQHTKMEDLIRGKQRTDKAGAWLKKAAGFAFKSFPKLWHVGTMNPKDKRNDSYEGAGLSVSVHPEEWSMIAKLPGDMWELTKAGNKFVNFHRLTKAQNKQIADWGIKNGYVKPANLWRHSWFDDEISEEGEWRYSDYATKEEAEAEFGGYGGEEKVEPVKGGMTATPKLSEKSKRGKIEPVEIMDLLVTAYAEDELDCDGVWWADILDPENLSAPRGVIFPSKLPSWKKRKLRQAAVNAPSIVHRGPQGFNVEYHNEAGERIGHLQIDVKGDTAIVKAIDTDENYQRQGIATKLYAAAKKELKKRGVKVLKGSLEGSGPVQIREKVFGPGSTTYYHGGEPIDTDQAIKVMDVDYGYTRAETRLAAGKTEWEQFGDEFAEGLQKLNADPWVEFVPISELEPLREYEWDQNYNRHGSDKFTELVEDMKRYGVREPITIRYFHDTKRAVIIEGNHRVAAAKAAGLKEVPARVTIASYPQKEYGHSSEGGKVRGRESSEKPYSDFIKPSAIGLSGKKTKTAAEEIYLYHGTSASVAEKIMLEGVMEAGSYWGSERIAETYAEEAVDAELDYEAEAEQAIIRVPLSRFNKATLKPDENSVAEPLTYTLKRKEEDLYAEWEQTQGTWQDSLRIYESVRYDAPLQVTKNDRYL